MCAVSTVVLHTRPQRFPADCSKVGSSVPGGGGGGFKLVPRGRSREIVEREGDSLG